MPGYLHLANISQEAFQLVRTRERDAPKNSIERRLFLFGGDNLALVGKSFIHNLRADVSKRFVTFQYLSGDPVGGTTNLYKRLALLRLYFLSRTHHLSGVRRTPIAIIRSWIRR